MNNNQPPLLLNEALEYKDLEGMMKPTMHVDEFASKMGEDDDVMVISFFVRSQQAARDLMDWFEKGYDWILDSDVSPGEIRPGRYLVYIEIRRRSSVPNKIFTLIDDLSTLTEFKPDDWTFHYRGQDRPFTEDSFAGTVPLSPAKYRQEHEQDLNEMRTAAGIEPVQIYERDRDIQRLQNAAGI